MALESASFLNDLVTTNPVAGDGVAQGDDHLRLLKTVLKASFPSVTFARYIEQARVDAADSATPALWAAASDYVNLLGSTTITGFASGTDGQMKLVRINANRTLTHHATTLDLPDDANISALAGDHMLVCCRGTTSNIVVAYFPAARNASETARGLIELATDAETQTGTDTARAITPANLQACTATETRKGVAELATTVEVQTGSDAERIVTPAGLTAKIASQADMETGTSVARLVTPGRQHFHPGHPKAGGNFDGTGTPAFRSGDYGMGAITDNGTGDWTLALDTAFANTNYWMMGMSRSEIAIVGRDPRIGTWDGDTKTTSAVQVRVWDAEVDISSDSSEVGVAFWGDYA